MRQRAHFIHRCRFKGSGDSSVTHSVGRQQKAHVYMSKRDSNSDGCCMGSGRPNKLVGDSSSRTARCSSADWRVKLRSQPGGSRGMLGRPVLRVGLREQAPLGLTSRVELEHGMTGGGSSLQDVGRETKKDLAEGKTWRDISER